MTPPGEGHVRALLDFARSWDRRAPLVIHCFAGISRSTAAAYSVAAALAPKRDEAELAATLRRLSPSATPEHPADLDRRPAARPGRADDRGDRIDRARRGRDRGRAVRAEDRRLSPTNSIFQMVPANSIQFESNRIERSTKSVAAVVEDGTNCPCRRFCLWILPRCRRAGIPFQPSRRCQKIMPLQARSLEAVRFDKVYVLARLREDGDRHADHREPNDPLHLARDAAWLQACRLAGRPRFHRGDRVRCRDHIRAGRLAEPVG